MLWPFNYWPSHIKLHKQVHDVAWTHRVHSAYNCIGIMLGVAFFILEVGGGITKKKFNIFKCFQCFLKLKISKDINPVRSFMANHCWKHFSLLRPVLRALLSPSMNPRMKTLQMQTIIHDLSSVPCSALCIPVFINSCGNTPSSDIAIEFECTNTLW